MKTIILFISTLFLFSNINSQIYNPVIDSLIAETNIDSLVSYVRILSGEDSVMIGDSLVLIEHRDAWLDNNLPADYIKQKLQNYFLPVVDTLIGPTIRNVIGIQEGIDNPEEIYIICAAEDSIEARSAISEISSTLSVYTQFGQNSLRLANISHSVSDIEKAKKRYFA